MSEVHYAELLLEAKSGGKTKDIAAYLAEQLPYEWANAYKLTAQTPTNIVRITTGTYEYLFDDVDDLIRNGKIGLSDASQPRVLAVHGRSRAPKGKRRDDLMRERPLGPVDVLKHSSKINYDKGHFIGHSLGGGLEINIFPQPTAINRGWSQRGKVYRAMERYCPKHPGTYCFSRPIYAGKGWHPDKLEFGVLKTDGALWIECFDNVADQAQMQEIERLLREQSRLVH